MSFVSLGCPKALVDSERIITRLRAEGYALDARAQGRRPRHRQHLRLPRQRAGGIARRDRRRAGRERQGDRHRLHGRGAGEDHRSAIPTCSRSPARSNTRACSRPCIAPRRRSTIRSSIWCRREGIKLTPRHYAYLKISEGCNNRCTFCIIPKLRGDLVSRPAADVLREAERLVAAGVKELLVISQDTSAYGVDIKYAASQWKDREVRAKFLDLARELGDARRLGAAALRLSLSARRRGDPADGGGQGAALSRHPVPARLARRAQAHEAPGRAGEDAGAHRALARDLPRPDAALDLHRRLSRRDRAGFRDAARLARRGRARPRRLLQLRAGARARPRTISPRRCRRRSTRSAGTASWRASRRSRRSGSSARSAPASRSSSTRSGRRVAKGRSKGDAPEIDGAVYVASRRPLRVGEIATVKIERADEYDLHGTAVGF